MRLALAWAIAVAMSLGGLAGRAAAAQQTVTPETFDAAVAEAKPGSVLLLADGVYRDVKLVFKGAGTSDRPIELRPEHVGKVVFTDRSQITMAGEYLVVRGMVFDQAWGRRQVEFSGAKHCRMTDCVFLACGDPKSTFSHMVSLTNGSQQNRVDHCYVEGSLSMSFGVRVSSEDHGNTGNTFDHNYFKDVVRRSDNGQEAIQIGQGYFSAKRAMHTLVEHNLFENVSGDAEIISNKSSCNILRYNTCRNCKGSITLRCGSSVLVMGNVLLRCAAGVRVHAVESVIAGNYIENCTDGVLFPMGDGPEIDVSGHTAGNHCVVANNVIRNCSSGISVGKPSARSAVAPFANAFYNNIVQGSRGMPLGLFSAENSTWAGNSIWAEGEAKAGNLPAGVVAEQVELEKAGDIRVMPELRARRIGEYAAEIRKRLSATQVGKSFEEIFLAAPPHALTPSEVGPAWMNGRPQDLPRLQHRKDVPPITKKAS